MTRSSNPAQMAGILSNQENFRRFAAQRSGFPDGQFLPEAAAEFIRRQCRITSRRQLNDSEEARNRFEALRTDFDAWRGAIASPRYGDRHA